MTKKIYVIGPNVFTANYELKATHRYTLDLFIQPLKDVYCVSQRKTDFTENELVNVISSYLNKETSYACFNSLEEARYAIYPQSAVPTMNIFYKKDYDGHFCVPVICEFEIPDDFILETRRHEAKEQNHAEFTVTDTGEKITLTIKGIRDPAVLSTFTADQFFISGQTLLDNPLRVAHVLATPPTYRDNAIAWGNHYDTDILLNRKLSTYLSQEEFILLDKSTP